MFIISQNQDSVKKIVTGQEKKKENNLSVSLLLLGAVCFHVQRKQETKRSSSNSHKEKIRQKKKYFPTCIILILTHMLSNMFRFFQACFIQLSLIFLLLWTN